MTLAGRLRAALPSPAFALAGSAAWAAAMAASAAAALLLRGWTAPAMIAPVVAVFFAGGLLAFAPAVTALGVLRAKAKQPAFAAAFLLLATATIGATALINGLVYREYYSAWHESLATKLGVLEFVFTIASGVYQFLVLGLRLMMPLGLAALIVAALLLMRWSQAKSLNPAVDSG